MKNNPLDDIVKCNVEISSPASNDVSFESILLVVAPPASSGTKTLTKTVAISKADDLLEYGFKATDVAYKAATVAFSQNPSPSELLICGRKKDSLGTNNETITETLNRANSEARFYGFHITEYGLVDKDVTEAVTWAEANEKIYGFEYADTEKCPVKNFEFYRSFGIYSGSADGFEKAEQPEENKYAALAWMAKCFGYNPGTETWHLKELATIVPSALSSEDKKKLADKKINTFLRYSGSNCTIGGYTLAGEWIDVIRFRDWLKAEMQTRVFNILKNNRKVPFTDSGIGLIEGAIESTLKEGQDIGGIAPTEYDKDDNAILGFSVHVPKASELTEAERKARKLTGCRYTARLSGAIHAVEIEGFLTF